MTQTEAKTERGSLSTQKGNRFACLHVVASNGNVAHNIVEGTINDEEDDEEDCDD